MKRPRLSISGLMVVVLVVALDFGIGKALTEPPLWSMPRTELLIIGGFPMANVLAGVLAFLVATRRDPTPRRSALVGFASFGLAVWLAFVAAAIVMPRMVNDPVLWLIMLSGLPPGFGLALLGAVAFLLPQLGFAAVGWRLGSQSIVRGQVTVDDRNSMAQQVFRVENGI